MTASTARTATTRTATKRTPAKRTNPAEAPAAKAVTAPVQNLAAAKKQVAAGKKAAKTAPAKAAAPVEKAPAKNRTPGRGTTLERLTAPVPTDAAELADHIGTARWAIRRATKSGNADLQLLAEVRLAQLLRVKEERAAKAN